MENGKCPDDYYCGNNVTADGPRNSRITSCQSHSN